MAINSSHTNLLEEKFENIEFEGLYGNFRLTEKDSIEVKRYRISVLCCGVSFCTGIIHWLLFGPTWAWLWLFPMAIGLGMALFWIHIYLRPLHKALQFFWAIGCLGMFGLGLKLGGVNLLAAISTNPVLILICGPFFAALTGLGFKEFFCFRSVEAIGLTILVPMSWPSHSSCPRLSCRLLLHAS